MNEIVAFQPEHARMIFDKLESSGISFALPHEEMISTYSSEGSIAVTCMLDGVPIACGGIIDLKWSRGEAWLLVSPEFKSHIRAIWPCIKVVFPELAKQAHFVRVQATCFNLRNPIFKKLKFEFEGELRHYGPYGENSCMFSRIFREAQ